MRTFTAVWAFASRDDAYKAAQYFAKPDSLLTLWGSDADDVQYEGICGNVKKLSITHGDVIAYGKQYYTVAISFPVDDDDPDLWFSPVIFNGDDDVPKLATFDLYDYCNPVIKTIAWPGQEMHGEAYEFRCE